MGKVFLFGITGVLALLMLDPDIKYSVAILLSVVTGPLAIPLVYVLFNLQALWLIASSFALAYAVTGRLLKHPILRALASASIVALVGFTFFVALPTLSGKLKTDRAARILAEDLPLPANLRPIRSIEIRLKGDQTDMTPHFGPGGCFDLCLDMLAAGVLDKVIIHTNKLDRVITRETVQSGCRSNLFGKNHQGREFRLHLAGYCVVSAPFSSRTPDDFAADVTFILTNEWADHSFKLRKIQAYDPTGRMLMQQSQMQWQESKPMTRNPFAARTGGDLIQHELGRAIVPFSWPEIANLFGLQSEGLKDLALTLPAETDPATINPPDVSFRMLENFALTGDLTDTEQRVFVSMMLQPSFRATDQTASALRAVLAKRPDFGEPIAKAMLAKALKLIENDEFYDDGPLRETLEVLRMTTPMADMPPVLAALREGDMSSRATAALSLANAATNAGAPPIQYMLPLLHRYEREASRELQPAEQPVAQLSRASTIDLNSAICRHASGLADWAALWLTWVTAHAAKYPEDRSLATSFGITAAHLGLPPKQVSQAFATSAGWSVADRANLEQSIDTPCPD